MMAAARIMHDVPMFPPDRRATPRSVTAWELLVWTYRDQLAHRYLKLPGDWFGYMVDISGLAGADAPRPKVDSDAVQVHTAVFEIGGISALLLMQYAAKGEAPEPSDMISRPCMVEADRLKDRYAWSMVDGRRVDYRIDLIERYSEQRPITRKVGRGKRVLVGTETVLVEIEACPIEYWPDPAYLLMIDAVYQRFVESMDRLSERLRALNFKRHILV
ncbi:MAG: hypothetical protein QOJ54_1021 [Aliidongia sp.]|jgi:hypothetical protein|nr:hypothetical protein [Aliidongia sp.]